MLNLEGDEINCLGWREFRKTEITQAVRMPQEFCVKDYYGQPTKGLAGDYLLKHKNGSYSCCPFNEFIVSFFEMETVNR